MVTSSPTHRGDSSTQCTGSCEPSSRGTLSPPTCRSISTPRGHPLAPSQSGPSSPTAANVTPNTQTSGPPAMVRIFPFRRTSYVIISSASATECEPISQPRQTPARKVPWEQSLLVDQEEVVPPGNTSR